MDTLIKWEDLEPGDIIKYTDELREFCCRHGFGDWCEDWCSCNLIINNIRFYSQSIEIYFSKEEDIEYTNEISIDYAGHRYVGFVGFTGCIFKIVSLKED